MVENICWEKTGGLRAALIEMAATRRDWNFHVTAQIHPGASQQQVETLISFWCQRANRFFLGRNWSKHPDRWMEGVAFFEQRPHNHAHMILRPPIGASRLRFQLHARFLFAQHPQAELRRCFPHPVHPRAGMFVQQIGPTPEDRLRVGKYATKEMEFTRDPDRNWKFLADLDRG